MSEEIGWEQAILKHSFEQRGYVEAEQRLHGALRFTYLPLIPEETDYWETLRQQAEARGPKAMQEARAKVGKMLAERIKSWNAKTGKGEDAPITEASLRYMRPWLQQKVYAIVIGFRASDIDPQYDTSDSNTDDDAPTPLEDLAEQLGK